MGKGRCRRISHRRVGGFGQAEGKAKDLGRVMGRGRDQGQGLGRDRGRSRERRDLHLLRDRHVSSRSAYSNGLDVSLGLC